MKKQSSDARRFASSAKLLAALLCAGFGWGAASSIPSDSTFGETWRFRFDSFALFSSNASSDAEERPVAYLDASGRRVVLDASGASVPRLETSPAFAAESTELLADGAPLAPQPVGASFDETEPELTPVSFANAESDAETLDAPSTDADWFVVDDDAQERAKWSRELRLESFLAPTFADSSAPTWRDAVPVEAATLADLRALEFEPGLVPSSLVSSALRQRAKAPLPSGDYSFAETSNASDANAPQTLVASSSTAPSTPRTSPVVPTRVGAFTACGTFEADGVAQVRVQ
ncbi:MAG: hypothetical protein IJZ10_01885 [Thermoguttaceae bacterium]|nr:hypothetical protein [Thermoguttaceae bacterium]